MADLAKGAAAYSSGDHPHCLLVAEVPRSAVAVVVMGMSIGRTQESRCWVEVEGNCCRWTEQVGLAEEGSIAMVP